MRDLHKCQEGRSYMRMTVAPPPPPGEREVRLYVNNVFEVRVKSKKCVRKFQTPFRSTKRLCPFAILHNNGRKDRAVDRVITWVGRGRAGGWGGGCPHTFARLYVKI